MFTLEKVPKRKCGVETMALGVLGGSSVLGTLGTFATNKSNQMYGASESNAARTWSTNERLAAQEYNTQERLATQEYNSPVNQMKMMRAAGLNPQALGQGVSFVGAQPQSSSPASAPMSGIGTSQVPNIPQLISSGSELVNALTKSKETEASLPLLGEQVKYYIQKTFGEQINNDLMQLEKKFKESTLPANIKSKFEELAKLEFEKVVAQQTGEKFKSENELIKTQNDVEKVIQNLKGEELIQAKYLTENWHRINNAMINLQKSQTAENYASAESHKADAALTRWQESFNRSNNDIIVSKLDQELRNLEKQGSIMEWQVDAAKSAAKIAEVQADHAEALFWKDFISDIVTQGFDAFLGYRNSKSWERLSKSSQSRAESRIRELEMQYGDSYTDEYSAYDSQGNKHTYKAKYHRGRASKLGK